MGQLGLLLSTRHCTVYGNMGLSFIVPANGQHGNALLAARGDHELEATGQSRRAAPTTCTRQRSTSKTSSAAGARARSFSASRTTRASRVRGMAAAPPTSRRSASEREGCHSQSTGVRGERSSQKKLLTGAQLDAVMKFNLM